MSAKPSLLLVRRVGDGPGGAAKTLRRFATLFSEDWTVETLSAGDRRRGVSGGRGPSWWRNRSFAASANASLANASPDLVFTLERGVRGDVYRTADGIHRRWLELAYANKPLARLANPLHTILPSLERDTFLAARRIVCQGAMIAGDVRRFHPDCAEKIRIIPTGVDHARFKPHPEGRAQAKVEAGLSPDVGLMLFVGSGWKIKGLSDTLRTFAAYVRQSGEKARLLIVGDGNERPYRALARSLGIADRVVFVGRIPDTAGLMRAADTVLMPSLYDTFPNAGLEALACGAPLLCTTTNGVSELVKEGESGVVLPPGFDPDEAAERLHRLLLSPPHPAGISAITAGHTPENERRLYLELLRETLAEKQSSR